MRQKNANRKLIHLYAAILSNDKSKFYLFDKRDKSFCKLVYRWPNYTFEQGVNSLLSKEEQIEIQEKSKRFQRGCKDIVELPRLSLEDRKNFLKKLMDESKFFCSFLKERNALENKDFLDDLDLKRFELKDQILGYTYHVELSDYLYRFLASFLGQHGAEFEETCYLV